MSKINSILLFIVGLINFFPVFGLLGRQKLERFYGVSLADPNLLILTLHRAVLFGLTGGFILYSVYREDLQTISSMMALVSLGSYIIIMLAVAKYNKLLKKVMIIDIVAIVLLIASMIIRGYEQSI